MTDRTEIIVPASIGNLGPGFDALSVALQLYLRVQVVEVSASAADALETEFEGSPPDGDNGVERAYRLARARTGVAAPSLKVRVRTDIPVRAGLGSSAAAAVAGLQLYNAMTSALTEDDMLALACELEGHPDNAAACLLGGLAVSCRHEDGRVTARSAQWPAGLRFVIATPETTALATNEARAVLPKSVSLSDAVFNLQRALLLVRAVEGERYLDLKEALRDRWHQPARSALVPGLRDALKIDDPAILGVCLSGSGPSIVAIPVPGREQEASDILDGIYRRRNLPVRIRVLAAHQPVWTGVAPRPLQRENTA